MRQDIRQELRKYQMDKIKPNFTELGRQLGCDPRTVEGGCRMQEIGGLKLSIFLHFLYTHFINLLRK